jgi:hypothetical protein
MLNPSPSLQIARITVNQELFTALDQLLRTSGESLTDEQRFEILGLIIVTGRALVLARQSQ